MIQKSHLHNISHTYDTSLFTKTSYSPEKVKIPLNHNDNNLNFHSQKDFYHSFSPIKKEGLNVSFNDGTNDLINTQETNHKKDQKDSYQILDDLFQKIVISEVDETNLDQDKKNISNEVDKTLIPISHEKKKAKQQDKEKDYVAQTRLELHKLLHSKNYEDLKDPNTINSIINANLAPNTRKIKPNELFKVMNNPTTEKAKNNRPKSFADSRSNQNSNDSINNKFLLKHTNNGFFKYNENNILSKAFEQHDPCNIPSDVENAKDASPLLVKIGINPHIIQPSFMQKAGSMCSTELWSIKFKNKYCQLMSKGDGKFLRITENSRFPINYIDGGVFKPDKMNKMPELIGKIQSLQAGYDYTKKEADKMNDNRYKGARLNPEEDYAKFKSIIDKKRARMSISIISNSVNRAKAISSARDTGIRSMGNSYLNSASTSRNFSSTNLNSLGNSPVKKDDELLMPFKQCLISSNTKKNIKRMALTARAFKFFAKETSSDSNQTSAAATPINQNSNFVHNMQFLDQSQGMSPNSSNQNQSHKIYNHNIDHIVDSDANSPERILSRGEKNRLLTPGRITISPKGKKLMISKSNTIKNRFAWREKSLINVQNSISNDIETTKPNMIKLLPCLNNQNESIYEVDQDIKPSESARIIQTPSTLTKNSNSIKIDPEKESMKIEEARTILHDKVIAYMNGKIKQKESS